MSDVLTAVAARLRGFEPVARHCGEAWARGFLSEYYRELADVGVGHDAQIEPLPQSQLLFLFPSSGAANAVLRAVHCGLDAQSVVLGLRNRRLLGGEIDVAEVHLGVGVATGGTDTAAVRERAVQLAERSGPGQVLLDQPTRDCVARHARDLRLTPASGEGDAEAVFRCERRRPALRKVASGR